MTELSPDNRLGLWMCNILATKTLPKKEKVFIASVMQQVLHNPETFRLSEKQLDWLKDIWRRHEGRSQTDGLN